LIGSVFWTVLVSIKDIIFSKEDTSGMISGDEFKRVFLKMLQDH